MPPLLITVSVILLSLVVLIGLVLLLIRRHIIEIPRLDRDTRTTATAVISVLIGVLGLLASIITSMVQIRMTPNPIPTPTGERPIVNTLTPLPTYTVGPPAPSRTPVSTLTRRPTWTVEPPAPSQTPVLTPATLTPGLTGSIAVLGNSNRGLPIIVPKSGRYKFDYESGAYNVDPSLSARRDPWLTAVFVFRGPPVWEGEALNVDALFQKLADNGYFATPEGAKAAAQGASLQVELHEGEVLTFIAVDSRSYYGDNEGQVAIKWSYLGQ